MQMLQSLCGGGGTAPEIKASGDGAKVDVTVLSLAGEAVATLSIESNLPIIEVKKQLGDPWLISLNWEGQVLKDSDTASTLQWPALVTLHMVTTTFDHERSIALLRAPDWKKDVPMDMDEVHRMCASMKEQLLKEPTVLELEAPMTISAHLTGNLVALNYIFDTCGDPSRTSHLFLGNYVSRGNNSLEVMILLLCYKKMFPSQVHLLRGKQECASIARIYGFYDECKRRFVTGSAVRVYKHFAELFNCLPLAAVIQSRIFCVSSGLSPHLQNLERLRNVQRPVEVGDEGLVCDLLWSDPENDVAGWYEQDKGVSYTFGPSVVEEFLKQNDMELLIRGSQVVEDGHEYFAARKGVTLFSSPGYMQEFDNKASVMILDEQLQHRFHTFDVSVLPGAR